MHIQQTRPRGAEFRIWQIWGAKERTFSCIFKWAWKLSPCRWEAGTQSEFRKGESELNSAVWACRGRCGVCPEAQRHCRRQGGPVVFSRWTARSETRGLPQGRAVVRRHFVLRSWLLAGSSASPLLTAGGRAFFVGGRAVHCTMVRSILTSTCRMPGASPVVVVTTERSPGLTKVGQRAQSPPDSQPH